jgi:hypothetical protein
MCRAKNTHDAYFVTATALLHTPAPLPGVGTRQQTAATNRN